MAEMEVRKRIYAVNPGRKRRKRNLSPLQKLFFGTKRQRASVRARRKNAGPFSIRKTKKHFKRKLGYKSTSVLTGKKGSGYGRGLYQLKRKGRKKNVGSIITVLPTNPGRKRVARRRKNAKRVVVINKGVKRMARRKRSSAKRVVRRRRNPVYRGRIKRGLYKYSSNPGRRRRRYSQRRRNGVTSRRRIHRRNPGMLSGTLGRVVGVLGGLAMTKLLSGFLPGMFQSGPLGYLAVGAVAITQGKLAGKFAKSPALGNDMVIGGLAYLAAKVLNDFFPAFGTYTGISGMGMIGPSSFYTPQVNQPGSMGSFVLPAATNGAMAAMAASAPKTGMGVLRRTGRVM